MNVGDIVEREVDSASVKPPAPPGPTAARPKKQSRWKQRNEAKKKEPEAPKPAGMTASEQIHMENLQKISEMSQAEFEENRDQLLGSLDAGVLQMLLKRAQAHEGGMLDEEDVDQALNARIGTSEQAASEQLKELQELTEQEPQESPEEIAGDAVGDDNGADKDAEEEDGVKVHFPAPPAAQELDVNDPDFMEQLHAKYFPTLETEPDKLQWMHPVSEEDMASYSEDQEAVAPSELRFDFHGDLLSPRQAMHVPTHLGLHHHGDAPHAAGYTVAELGHLARSTVASQRCIAIRTLGRVLYKLGKGVYGKEISMGLWGIVDYARVMDTLHEAADEARTASVTVRAHAVEALWLWHQGGGKRLAR